jgi:hypothetical protein
LVFFCFTTKVQFDTGEAWNKYKRSKTGKKNLKTVVKSSVLFNPKPRCMETFRSDNKKLLFRSGFIFKVKKIAKTVRFDILKIWNKSKRSVLVLKCLGQIETFCYDF